MSTLAESTPPPPADHDPDSSASDAAPGASPARDDILHHFLTHPRQLFDLIDGSPDAIFIESTDGSVLYANRAACDLHERTRDELIGMNVLDLVPPEHREAVASRYPGWMTGELNTYEGYSYTKSGRSIPVEVRARPIQINDQPAILLHICDVSQRHHEDHEQRQWEARMQNAQKLEGLGVLAGGIAHDFNNLLMGILGNAELALQDVPPGSPATVSLRGIETAATRAADLCQQMLAYAGRGQLKVELLDVNKMVKEIGHLVSRSISKKARLRYDLTPRLPAITGDATQLRQVVLNMITNASEALGDVDGTIRIATGLIKCDAASFHRTWMDDKTGSGRCVYLEVSDTGCGMSRTTIKSIFDPFYTTKFAGRGLGLAAVLGIVRSHKGALKVDSEPERGTTFTIYFPESGELPLQKADAEAPSAWRGEGLILVVDDEQTVRSVATRMVSRMGFNALTATDGDEALRVFRERSTKISCVLLDLTMPGIDGVETYRQMRALNEKVPVIISSGFNKPDAIARFGDPGPAAFVQKPYRSAALGEALRDVLEKVN